MGAKDDTTMLRKWVRVPGLEDVQPGDLVMYRISCQQEGGANDSGHIMFVLEKPTYVDKVKCQGTQYHRYKLKIADASKKFHFGDTRSKCSGDRYGTVPTKKDLRKLGCGVGEGWIYAWARTCPTGGCKKEEGKRRAIVAVQLFPGKASTKCFPSKNKKCHNYRIGRFTRKR